MGISDLENFAEINLSQSKILVVDDQPINIQAVYNILSSEYTVLAATSGPAALDVCNENLPDLILLDVLMPDMSGLELCDLLKQNNSTRDIPIIFVTSFNQQHEEDECWARGGVDFIMKPVNPMTLKNRVNAHLTLKAQKDMLHNLVYVDSLTKVFNRRYLDLHVEKLKNEVKRSKVDAGLLMIDIDHFKAFNDEHGHIEGDKALISVAEKIKGALLRPSDFVARFGGEEFSVVLPDTDLKGALDVAERIRKLISEKHMVNGEQVAIPVAVSIGVSTVLSSEDSKVVDTADKNLYHAKNRGRNQVYHSSMEE
jgi:diguanylate cyclase (GGDEF)-like protein